MCNLAGNLFLAAGDLISLLPFCQVEQTVKAARCAPGTNEQLNRWHESEQEFQWTFLELERTGDPWPCMYLSFPHSSLFLFFPPRDYNYPICYPTLFLFLFIFSSTFSEGANAVVVLKLKSLTRRCHSAVPLHCFPIMWDFGLKDDSSFSNVWAFTPNIPSSSSHCDWPGAFQGYRFDLSTLLGQ